MVTGISKQKARLVRSLREWQRRLYYRFGFGRENWLARRWAASVAAWEQARRKGDAPAQRGIWEEQYASDKWKFLGGLPEVARYSVIAGYIAYLKTNPAILDVGCGEGHLFHRCRSSGYSSFVGIDLSETALAGLRSFEDDRTHFVQADAETYDIEAGCFDVVVYNESLYYFHQPLATVRRHAQHLKVDGVVIISTYLLSQRAIAILERIKAEFVLLDETQVAHGGQSSLISVFAASRPDQQP